MQERKQKVREGGSWHTVQRERGRATKRSHNCGYCSSTIRQVDLFPVFYSKTKTAKLSSPGFTVPNAFSKTFSFSFTSQLKSLCGAPLKFWKNIGRTSIFFISTEYFLARLGKRGGIAQCTSSDIYWEGAKRAQICNTCQFCGVKTPIMANFKLLRFTTNFQKSWIFSIQFFQASKQALARAWKLPGSQC